MYDFYPEWGFSRHRPVTGVTDDVRDDEQDRPDDN
jgi:hypothetical protein